jgi:hypothetical protein
MDHLALLLFPPLVPQTPIWERTCGRNSVARGSAPPIPNVQFAATYRLPYRRDIRTRNQFPADLFLLLPVPLIAIGFASLATEAISPLISGFRHPTPTVWLWAVSVSLGASLLGAVLLFMAKLPAYRALDIFSASEPGTCPPSAAVCDLVLDHHPRPVNSDGIAGIRATNLSRRNRSSSVL